MSVTNFVRFAVKHAVAATVVISAAAILSAVSYFALFIWALFAGSPIGSPLAFPFMVLVAIVASVLIVLLVLFPVTWLAELYSKRWLHWHVLSQIPISTIFMILELLCIFTIFAWLTDATIKQGLAIGGIGALVLLVPLGAYWWSLQSTDWLIGLGLSFLKCLSNWKARLKTAKAG